MLGVTAQHCTLCAIVSGAYKLVGIMVECSSSFGPSLLIVFINIMQYDNETYVGVRESGAAGLPTFRGTYQG